MYDTCELEYLISKTTRVIKSCKTVAQLMIARDFVWLAHDRYFKLTSDIWLSYLFGMEMCLLISDMFGELCGKEMPEALALDFNNPFAYPVMPEH